MPSVKNLIRIIYNEYAESIGLDPEAKYIHGTPLKPVVPLDTGKGGLFILGAYPSARFATINGVLDVPVADNLGPFESERWFDGSRVRQQPSARELEDLFLSPLHVARSGCWITDLVKVFLFKNGHKRKYATLGTNAPVGYTRDRFFELGIASMPWIERELRSASPSLVITLGAEVAGVLRGVHSSTKQTNLLVPEVSLMEVGSMRVPTIHCAHPGILMRRSPGNAWPQRHADEFIPALRRAIANAGEGS